MSSIWSSTPRMSFLRFWGAKELKGPLPQLPYRTPLPLTPKLHRVPASLIFSVLPFWDLPGARWPGCSGPCAPRQHRPTPDGGKAGSCPGNVPYHKGPTEAPPPQADGHLCNGHLLPLEGQSDLLQLVLGEGHSVGMGRARGWSPPSSSAHLGLLHEGPLPPKPRPGSGCPPATAARRTPPPGTPPVVEAAKAPCPPVAGYRPAQGTAEGPLCQPQGEGQHLWSWTTWEWA